MARTPIPWTRLAAEFVVIVVGVLVALAADAWWESREDRDRAADYAAQILADSRTNLVLLDSALAAEEWHMALAERVDDALKQDAVPNVDSVRVWLDRRWDGWWYSDPRLLTGTTTALVETGDLTLLGDPALRSAILEYRGQIESDLSEFRRAVQMGMEAIDRLAIRGESSLTGGVGVGEDREVRRTVTLHRDPEGRAAMERLATSYYNRIWYLREMRSATGTLISALESR